MSVPDRKESGVIETKNSPYSMLKTIPVSRVRLAGFWEPRLKANRETSIMALFKLLKEHGIIDNFLIASGRKTGERKGPLFTDSDLYKWIEAAAFVLQSGPAPEILRAIDEAVDAILPAQQNDGYLNTYFTGERACQRYTNFHTNHEFYCAGHLFQASIALYRATGDRRLLDCSKRFADHLVDTFGPGKREDGYSGHPELEMAMVELYRTLGNRHYLEFTKYLLEKHDFARLREMDPRKYNSTGHAVRAGYLCSGGADYYMETGDEKILEALEALWQDVILHKIYITGGSGSRYEGETYGDAYELPNLRAYAETCAAISNIFWNFRMLCIKGEARFADWLERTLYNGFLSGVSLDGTKYFYVNPLSVPAGTFSSWAGVERQPWFDCTCCPPNVQRMLASLPGYFYTTSPEGLWVHLYCESVLDWHIDGRNIKIEQKTRYPWDGKIEIKLGMDSMQRFDIFLRIPGWSRKYKVAVNGKKIKGLVKPGSYLKIRREWKNSDTINLEFDMPALLMQAHPRVESDRQAVAVMRGPLVYCIESVDNPKIPVIDARIIPGKNRPESGIRAEFKPDLLGGIVILKAKGFVPAIPKNEPLYKVYKGRERVSGRRVELKLIPYYAWANRGISQMQVWLPIAPFS